MLGVDTEVVVDGEALGKPAGAAEAEAMLERLSGRTHEVVSGLCLRTPAWEELHGETTLVTFRPLTARDLAHYSASGEWEGRAGGYAIQGLGASLVERIEGDYLNVVGLPAGAPRPSPGRPLPRHVRLRLIQPRPVSGTGHGSGVRPSSVEVERLGDSVEAAPRPL